MIGGLNLSPSIRHPDQIYSRLIGMHEGLNDEESAILNARLIMILVNHIGDDDVVTQAISLALQGSAARDDKPRAG